MEPDRSSRVAARRIVEEVLADHAARATALDGAEPVTIVERPDTPSWRAARRIVEETLAEHAARAVVPPSVRLDVAVDLEERDIEVEFDLDRRAPETEPRTEQTTPGDESDPAVANVVAPIERDETPAKAARRVAAEVLTDHDVDPDAPTGSSDAPTAFEIDPVPGTLPEPPEPITTGTGAAVAAAAVEPSETVDPDDPGDAVHPEDAGPTGAESVEPTWTHESLTSDEVDGEEVIPVDDARLRAAIPERLFAPDPGSTDAGAPLDEPSTVDVPDVAPSVDGPPPPPRTLEPVTLGPPDPDAPVAIAARIVADVLAMRERAAQEARTAQEAQAAREAHDAELAALEEELGGSEPPEEAAARASDAEPETGPAAPESPDAQPPGLPEGWAVVPGAAEQIGSGSPSGVMIVDAGVDDLSVLDPTASGQRTDDLEETDGFWTGQEALLPETEDEFGGWPDPIAPPRRTGRWLITTVLGAVLLALLLPLAIGALRDLLSFS